MSAKSFSIGVLSNHTGVKVETIRYYERIGLMPPPARSAGGQRLYEHPQRERLSFIRRCRDLGFSLDSVRSLVGLNDQSPTCSEVEAITLAHLAEIRAKIKDLQHLETVLQTLAKDCEGGDTPDCAIINALWSDQIG